MDIDPAEIRAVVDREAIRDAILRYTRGLDREDEELLLRAFHEDGRDDHGTFIGRFLDFPRRKSRTNRRWKVFQHYVTNHSIDLAGDEAHVETYFLAVLKRADGVIDLTGGRYADRLERRAGRWAIVDRVVIVEWAGGLPPGGASTVPEGLFMASAHDRSDPTYQRPLKVTRAFRDEEA